MTVLNTIGNFLNQNSATIGNALGSVPQLYGQQNAGQAISSAATAGIGQANKTLGNINSLYTPQSTLGNQAMTTMSSSLGLNGKPANYSNFLNMPGYQFAVGQGTQAIQRQAASMGSAYTPNTAQAVGQYVTGTAMQDYNTYINQLNQASQFGQNANAALSNANLNTAGNIEQLGMNAGMGQAGMYTGMGQTIGGGGVNGSGVGQGGAAGASPWGALIGKGLGMLGSWMTGGSSGGIPSDQTTYLNSLGGNNPFQGLDQSGNPPLQNFNIDSSSTGSVPNFLSGSGDPLSGYSFNTAPGSGSGF